MKILELLSDKKKWTQNTYARNAMGYSVLPRAVDAASWCLLGALSKCYPDRENNYAAHRRMTDCLPKGRTTISSFNDQSTFRQVRALLKKANV